MPRSSRIAAALVLALLVPVSFSTATEPDPGPSAWEKPFYTQNEKSVETYADAYRSFLSSVKTEREVVSYLQNMLDKAGFKDLDRTAPTKLKPGMKIYRINRSRMLFAAVIGTEPVSAGLQLLQAHADAVRIDLKPHPLYQQEGFAMLQTHYYGGMKKFLYLNTPLALHGTVIKKDGTEITLSVGEKAAEPILVIPDLLIHLSYQTDAGAEISGEHLDPLAGSIASGPADEAVKTAVAGLLERQFGITGEDFISADLSLVPAGPAREVGFDRSMVGGYGQDDRACVYALVRALIDVKTPARTAAVLIDDKEEVGYPGTTGHRTPFVASTVTRLLDLSGLPHTEQDLRRALAAGRLYYCDLLSGVNPLFPEVHELSNAARLGYGPVLNTLAEEPEHIARTRRVLDKAGIPWQTGEFGKSPGAFTNSRSPLEMGMPTVFIGLSSLSIHSPFSITSKIDVFGMYKGCVEILKAE